MVPAPLEIHSPRYIVRPLESEDFWHLRRLEAEIWGGDATGQLCPHYLRLCTELYPEWCFLALDGERPAGYVLNFPNGKVAYCATLAVHPDYQKGKVNHLLIRAMLAKLFQEDMLGLWHSSAPWEKRKATVDYEALHDFLRKRQKDDGDLVTA